MESRILKTVVWLLLVSSLFTSKSQAQSNISIDDNCMFYNAIIIFNILNEVRDIHVVDSLCKNKFIQLHLTVDSAGIAIALKGVRITNAKPKILEIDEKLVHDINEYLMHNPTFFFHCYGYDPLYRLSKEDFYKSIVKNRNSENRELLVYFPGEKSMNYLFDLKRNGSAPPTLSLYEYMQSYRQEVKEAIEATQLKFKQVREKLKTDADFFK